MSRDADDAMLQQTISELQSRIAFQEDALQSLNKTVFEQQQSIDTLNKQLKHLMERVNQYVEHSDIDPGSEKPPHY